MARYNWIALLLGLSNIGLLFLCGLINELTNQWGFVFFFPAVLLFPAFLFLDKLRALLVLFISGLYCDQALSSSFGYHAFALCFLYLLLSEFFPVGQKKSLLRPVSIQVLTHFLLALGWFLFLKFSNDGSNDWAFFRFLSDTILSGLLLFPVFQWYPRFCEALIQLVGANSLRESFTEQNGE